MSAAAEAARSDAVPWKEAGIIIAGSHAELSSTYYGTTTNCETADAHTAGFPQISPICIALSDLPKKDGSSWWPVEHCLPKQLQRRKDFALQNAILISINNAFLTDDRLPRSMPELQQLARDYSRVLIRILDSRPVFGAENAQHSVTVQNRIHAFDFLRRRPYRSLSEVMTTLPTEANSALGFDTAEVLLEPSSLAREKNHLLGELRAYGKMEQGWDGEDAEPLKPEAIKKARAFLDALERRAEDEGMASDRVYPRLDPARDGSMTLFWDSDDFFASIDFDGGEKARWYVRSVDGRRDGNDEAFDGFTLPPRFWELLGPHLF